MSKRVEHQITVTADVPLLPNFIRSGELVLPVEQFSDDILRKLGKAWTEALIEHARKRRKANRRSP
jgi:hypothetical protein